MSAHPSTSPSFSQEGPTSSPTPDGWFPQGDSIDGTNRADLFGSSVALSNNGQIMAAGAYLNDDGGTNAGHVRVLQFNTQRQEWDPLGQAILGEERLDRFGTHVALSSDGKVLAASAPFHDGPAGSESGQVRIFGFDESLNDWVQWGSAIVGIARGDESGSSIALAGNGRTIAIGSSLHKSDDAIETGLVSVFQYNDTAADWTQVGSNIVGFQDESFFGCSVSMSDDGTILAVGAQFFDDNNVNINAGLVQVYAYNGLDWIPFGPGIRGAAAGDSFGVSVSLSSTGRFLAAGSRRGNDGTGDVRVFFYSIATGTWTQVGNPISGQEDNETFGATVSLSADGTLLAVGAPQANNLAGATRVYSLVDLEWFQVGEDLLGDEPGDESGASIALAAESTVVAIGVPGSNDGGTNAGQVQVFRNPFDAK